MKQRVSLDIPRVQTWQHTKRCHFYCRTLFNTSSVGFLWFCCCVHTHRPSMCVYLEYCPPVRLTIRGRLRRPPIARRHCNLPMRLGALWRRNAVNAWRMAHGAWRTAAQRSVNIRFAWFMIILAQFMRTAFVPKQSMVHGPDGVLANMY